MPDSRVGMRRICQSVSASDWTRIFSWAKSDGAVKVDEGLDEPLVGGNVVSGQQDCLAGEGGFDGVVGGRGFAGLGLGTGRLLAVGAVGGGLSGR